MPDLIHPWNMDDFKKSKLDLQIITENLYRLGYPMKQFANKPSGQIVRATQDLLIRLDDRQCNGKVPWAVVISNISGLLQALANTVPMTFALSTSYSVMTVDSSELIEVFLMKRPSNMFDDDPAGNILHDVKNAGLLFWKNPNSEAKVSNKFSGSFNHIINHRLSFGTATVFSAIDDGSAKLSAKVDKLFEELGETYGSEFSSTILQNAEIVHYKTDPDRTDVSEVRI